MDKTFRVLILIVLLCSFPHAVYSADFEDYYTAETVDTNQPAVSPADRVTLNADRVSFNDETGHATAEGNAVLTYQGTTIMAERIDYDSDTQKVEAMPMPGQKVLITDGTRTIRGDQIDYDLNSREGILTGAASRVNVGENSGVLYIYGSDINIVPWELAQERGLVKGSPEEYVVQWRNVVLTTCALEHPHYRLESKNVSFIPGRSVTAHKPRVYLGNTYLFSLPIDYVMRINRKVNYSFLPYFRKSEEKGTGGGITGSVGWETGSLSLGLSYMDKAEFEFMFELEQQLNDYWSFIAGAEHSWDEEWDERVWRPYGSLLYNRNGWSGRMNLARNEYITDRKNSYSEFRGRLDRRPEVIVWAPWFRNFISSWMRIGATVGGFKETIKDDPDTDVTTRYGMMFRNYYEQPLNQTGTVEIFADINGQAWFYDRQDADHEMLRSFAGLRYTIGAFEFGTGYERQYAWGESPMHWDTYGNRERTHQKVRLPLGREIYVMFRGSYDLNESMIDEMNYSLQWISDCMTWDLHYKDDKNTDGDDEIGLSISLNAFPDRINSFGEKIETDPFLRPKDVPARKR